MTSFLSNTPVPLWMDPTVTGINKLPGRSSHRFYPDPGSAVARGPSAWELELDGEWEFLPAPNPGEAERLLDDPPADWQRIRVPGHPELQGFGHPHYTNIQMPFACEPPNVPEDNPTGLYRRTILIPRSWAGLCVILHFGGAESFLSVSVNGRQVGVSKGSRTPAEFDITPLVTPGETLEIVALVAKWSDACFVEDQDMWWLSGLPRGVALLAMPPVHAADIFLRSTWEGDACGRIEAEVLVPPNAALPPPAAVELQIYKPDGQPLWAEPLRSEVSWKRDFTQLGRSCARFEAVTLDILPWNHEEPNLYTALVSVSCGQWQSHSAVRTGFRRVEVKGGALLVNGCRLLVCGVNRHEFDPVQGRAVPEDVMRRDIELLKRFHFNAVRCSHYPPSSRWLELCDEAGLYVIDEADIESHAFHNSLCDDPRYASAWLDRSMRMVRRDKNHPCVIAWSLGNESGYGANHAAAAGWVRSYDPTRPLHYEGAISEHQSGLSYLHGSAVTDIICPMYPEIQRLREAEQWLESLSRESAGAGSPIPTPLCHSKRPLEPTPVPPWERPIIPCEYSHSMGNSNGSLADYFALFRSSRRIQGGFIWEWCDHGIRCHESDGRPYDAYGGDFGDTPHDANFVCDGLVSSDRTPHPALHEHRFLAQPVAASLEGKTHLRICNRQEFTNSAWMDTRWEFHIDGQMVADGLLEVPPIPPGGCVEVELPALTALPASGNHDAVLRLNWTAQQAHGIFAAGENVAWQEFLLHKAPPHHRPPSCEHVPALREEGDLLLVQAGALQAAFNRSGGSLVSLARPGTEPITTSLMPCIWRAATDNDGIRLWSGQDGKALGRWLKLGLDRTHTQLEEFVRGADGGLIVRQIVVSRHGFPLAACQTSYAFADADSLWIEHRLELTHPEATDLPRVGACWQLPKRLARLRFFGLGPFENYPDRRSAALLGIYENSVRGEFFPYAMPQETGHHCEARWVELTDADGQGLRFDFEEPLGFNALPFTAEEIFACTRRTHLPESQHTVLNLDAAHRGLGTASCGPDTLPEFRVDARGYRWAYRMTLL